MPLGPRRHYGAAIIGRPEAARAASPSTNSSNRAWSTSRRSDVFLQVGKSPSWKAATAHSFSGVRPTRYISPNKLWPTRSDANAESRRYHVVVCRSQSPERSRINYQIEVKRGEHVERFNDPLNSKLSHSPFGAISVCFSFGYLNPGVDLSGPGCTSGRANRTSRRKPRFGARLASDIYLPAGSVALRRIRCWWYTMAAISCSTPQLRSYSTTLSIAAKLPNDRSFPAPEGSACRVRQFRGARPLPY